MIFNSLTFVVYLSIIVVLYWILPKRSRLWMIFLGSIIFYGFWRWEFLSIVLLSTILDYFISLELEKSPNHAKRRRKGLLLISLGLNLGLLLFFKYTYFIVDNLNFVFGIFGSDRDIGVLEIILPLGISFYTFQTISYTIDVYRGHARAEKSFVLYACYVTFFPQLVAGPILRAGEVINQLVARPKFKPIYLEQGLKRILYGFFLKVVLADNIAPLVDDGFALGSESLGGLDVWVLSFLFGFQIYFDFAGYSHIAIGCAKLMGIKFPENFNFPYAARSFKSFWKRWHISLSSWIRDYLYLPLSGANVIDSSKKSSGGLSIVSKDSNPKRKNTALFLTWAIMGLWHGANWTFVFWGVYHSILIYFERLFIPIRQKVPLFNNILIGWCITIPLAMLGWIPFRATTINDALVMYYKLIHFGSYSSIAIRENTYIITFLLFLSVSFAYLFKTHLQNKMEKIPMIFIPFNITKYAIIFFFVYTFFRPINQFIYFQF